MVAAFILFKVANTLPVGSGTWNCLTGAGLVYLILCGLGIAALSATYFSEIILRIPVLAN